MGAEDGEALRRGDANEGDTLAVRRPYGIGIPVDTGIEESEHFRVPIINTYEAMVAAVADES